MPVISSSSAGERESGTHRASGRLTVEFGEFLVDPIATVMAAPDLAVDELPVDRTAGHDHGPEVPDLAPARLRAGGYEVAIERHGIELTDAELTGVDLN